MPEVEKVDTNQNFYYLNILLDSMAQGNAADLIGTPLGLQFSATYSKKEINLFLQLVDEYLEMRAGSVFFIRGMRFLIIIIYLLALAFFIFITKGSISFIYNLAAEMSLNVDEAGEGILKNLSAQKDLDSILINAIKIILDYGAWPLLSSKIAEILAKEDMHELSQFEKLVLNQLTKYGINKENFGILDTIIRQMLTYSNAEKLGKLISCIIKRDIPGFFANILAFSSVVNQVPQILPIFSAIIDESSLGVKYPIFTHELKALFANPNFQTSLAAVLTPDESAQPDKFAQYIAIARDCYVGSLRAKAIEEIARIIGGTAEFGDLKVTLVQVKKLQNALDTLSNKQLLAIIAQDHDRQEERAQAIAEFLAIKAVKDLKIPSLTAEMLTDVVFLDIDFNNIKENLCCSAMGEQKNTISRIVNLLDDENLVNLVKKQIVPKFLDSLDSMVRILLTAKESLTSEELIIRNKLDQHGITVKTIKTNLNQVLADPANFKAVLSGLISGNFNEILDKVLPFVIRLEAVPNLFGMVMEREYSHLMPLITAMSQDPEATKQLQDLLGDAQLGSIVRDFTASSKLRADIINKLAEILIDPSFEPTDIAKLKNELNKLYTSDILEILGLGTDTHDKENLQDTAIKELFKVNLMHGGKPFTSEDLKRNLQQNQRKIPEIKDLIAQKYDLSAGAVQKIVYAFSDPRMLAILDKHGVHAAKAMFDIATATDLTYEEYEIQELFREYIGLTPENSEVLRPYLDASFFTLYGQISTAQKDALSIIFSKFASGDIKQILDGTCEAAKILCETNEGKEILQKKLWPIALELANRVLDPKKQDELSANEKKLAAILNQYGIDRNILLLVNYLIAENLDSIPVLTSSLLQKSGNFFKWASSVIITVEWNENAKDIVCAHPESIRKLIQGIVMQVPRAKALFDEYGIDIKALEIIDVALAPPSSTEKLRLVKQLFIGLGKILNNDPIDANGIDDILSSVEQLTMDQKVIEFLKGEIENSHIGQKYPHVMALITTILHDQESVKGLQTLLDETRLGSIITNFKIASKLRVEIIEKVLELLIDSPFDPKNATQLKLKDELSKLYNSDLLAIIDLDAAMQNNELLHVRNDVINALLDVDMMPMGRHFTREDLEKNLQQNKRKIAEIKSLIAHKSDLNAGAVQKIVYALSNPSMITILDKHGVVTANAMFEIATVPGLTYKEYEIQELLREYVGLTPENSYVLRHLNSDFFAMYRQISVEQKDAINVICSKFASGDIKQILDGTCEAAKILCATKEGKEILQKKLWPIAMELANRVLDPENQNKLSTNEKKLAAILNQYGIDKNILLLANHLTMTNPELISSLTSSLLQESGHFFKWVSLVIGAIEGDQEGRKIVYANPESIRKLIQSIAMQVPKAKAVFDEFGIDIKLLEIIDMVLSPPNTAEKMQLAQQLFNNLDKVLNTYPVDPCDINSLLGDIIALMNHPEVKIFLEIDNNQQLLLKVFGKVLPIIIADQLDPYNKCVADRFLVEFKRSNPDVKIPPDIEYLFIKLQDISILEEWIKTPEAQGITISAATKKRFNNEIEKTKNLIAGLKEDHRKNLASKLADILPKICKFPDLIAAARVIYSDSSYFYKAVGTACIGLTLSNEVINIKTAMIGLNAYFFYSLPKNPYIVYEKKRKKLELLKEQIPFNSEAIAKAESKLRTLGLELVGKTKQELTGKIADLVFAKLFGYGSGRSEEQEVIRNIISELRELDPFILKDMFTADDGSYDPNNINPRYLPLIDQLAVMFLMKSERTYLSQYFCVMGIGSGIQFTQKLKEYTTVFLKDRKSFADTMIDLVRDYVALNETSKVDILRVPADVEKRLNPKHYWIRLAIKDDLITRCLLHQDKISDVDISEIIKIYGEGIDKIENPSQLKAFLENKKPLLNAVFMSQSNSSAPSQSSMM